MLYVKYVKTAVLIFLRRAAYARICEKGRFSGGIKILEDRIEMGSFQGCSEPLCVNAVT